MSTVLSNETSVGYTHTVTETWRQGIAAASEPVSQPASCSASRYDVDCGG